MVVEDIVLQHEFCYDLREMAVRTYNRAVTAGDIPQYNALVALLLLIRDHTVAGTPYVVGTGVTGSPYLPRGFTDECRRIVYRSNAIDEPYQVEIKADIAEIYSVINVAAAPV